MTAAPRIALYTRIRQSKSGRVWLCIERKAVWTGAPRKLECKVCGCEFAWIRAQGRPPATCSPEHRLERRREDKKRSARRQATFQPAAPTKEES